jgi:hypothetical protein
MNHQPSQFEIRNRHGLIPSPMIFLFCHSLKTSKLSKLSVKNFLLPGDRTYRTSSNQAYRAQWRGGPSSVIEQHIKHLKSGGGTGGLCWNPRIYSLHWSMALRKS